MLKKILLMISLSISSAFAQIPDDFTLNDLSNYINRDDNCRAYSCNSLNSFSISKVENNVVTFDIGVSARKTSEILIPFSGEKVNIKDILLDGKKWYGARKESSNMYVVIPEGIHTITLVTQLKEPLLRLNGLPNNFISNLGQDIIRLSERNNEYFLELGLGFGENKFIKEEETLPITPYFIVSRELELGNRWRMKTTIYPISSINDSRLLNIKLLDGESVLTEGIQARNGQVNVIAGNTPIIWESIITPQSGLQIKGEEKGYINQFSLNVEKDWVYKFSGMNPNIKGNTGYSWIMWPNDILILNFEKPNILKGENINIENVIIRSEFDTQPFNYNVDFKINSSLGGRTHIILPEGYTSRSLRINNIQKETNQELNTISLDLNSGENNVSLVLNKKADWQFKMDLPILKFEKDPVNVTYNLSAYQLDRWILWAGGSDLNPPILLWGVLVGLLVVAIGLKYLPTPLSWLSWALLLFGLSQSGINSIVLVVLTFMIVGFKPLIYKNENNLKFYNTYQIFMAIMLLISATILLFTLRQGLLFNPETFSNNYLVWFSEQMKDKSAWFISLPLWVYHSLMFAWAIWLAYVVTIWSKWIWLRFISPTLWRQK